MPLQNATTLHDHNTKRLVGVQLNEPDAMDLIPLRESLATDMHFMSPSCVMIKHNDGTYVMQWLP